MRVLLDTNVVLDHLLDRPAWFEHAAAIWDASEDGRLESFITATTLTTVYYVARRERSMVEARRIVRVCLDELVVISVDGPTLEMAYRLSGPDFEDDLQIACATILSLDAIVTRDRRFPGSSIAVLTPAELVARLG